MAQVIARRSSGAKPIQSEALKLRVSASSADRLAITGASSIGSASSRNSKLRALCVLRKPVSNYGGELDRERTKSELKLCVLRVLRGPISNYGGELDRERTKSELKTPRSPRPPRTGRANRRELRRDRSACGPSKLRVFRDLRGWLLLGARTPSAEHLISCAAPRMRASDT
jgi:hypothetical protein